MATYRIIGKRMHWATTVDEVTLGADGAQVVMRRAGATETLEVGALVVDPPQAALDAFPDRFALVPEPEALPEAQEDTPEPEAPRRRR